MIPVGDVIDREHFHPHVTKLLERGHRVWFAQRGAGWQVLVGDASGPRLVIRPNGTLGYLFPQLVKVELPEVGPCKSGLPCREVLGRPCIGPCVLDWSRRQRSALQPGGLVGDAEL